MRVISGTAKGTQLKTPDGMLTRPTADRVKEALFSILQFDIPGTEVLDLFGGTGQLGIEALSRGSTSATFVDAREDACKLIRENLRRTHMLEKGEVVHMDYLSYLNQCRKRYHIVFLDPPYAETFLENSLNHYNFLLCHYEQQQNFYYYPYVDENFLLMVFHVLPI